MPANIARVLLLALAAGLIVPGALVINAALNIQRHGSVEFPADSPGFTEQLDYPTGSSIRYDFQVTAGGPVTLEIVDEHNKMGFQLVRRHANLTSATGLTGTLVFVFPSPDRFYLLVTHGNGSEANPTNQTLTLHKYPPVNLASVALGGGLMVGGAFAAVAALVVRRSPPAGPAP